MDLYVYKIKRKYSKNRNDNKKGNICCYQNILFFGFVPK